jgi:ribosomal-protein-alanine N-acetyltransferase
MLNIDPTLATVHAVGAVTKISFISGHVAGALASRADDITRWCASLAPTTNVRTGAVTTDIAALLQSFGFTQARELVLMERELEGFNTSIAIQDWAVSSWRCHFAARIDARTFPVGWDMTRSEITHALRATTDSGIAFVTRGRQRIGYALVGASMDHAYLQRIAVLPTAQGLGFGALLAESCLQWAMERGAAKMFVNTESDNQPALSLYQRFGFEQCGERLFVMEKAATNQ